MDVKDEDSIGAANASPSKAFFVRMLTRDIELQDALLDLLDNCLDGVIRTERRSSDPERPYLDFWAKMELSGTHLVIEDNCGGIPFKTAKEYAFALGRPDDVTTDAGSGTVGMYGIGMKRAIFKLGTDAHIESRNDHGFQVEITPDWMLDPKWTDLPMFDLPDEALVDGGTRITVYELHPDVKKSFDDPQWIDNFRTLVMQHYSIIIGKGLSVTIGSPSEIEGGIGPLKPTEFRLLRTLPDEGTDAAIRPYVYAGHFGDVYVEIYAGLYRELPTEEEAELEEETRGDRDDAGWTIACNDRVVVWKDKSRLTGWGEATVPNYHGQFIAITGIVLLHSKDPKLLPLTTTKRGVDAGSQVYLDVKELMREATKALTGFTNKWKKFPTQREAIYRSAVYLSLADLVMLPVQLSLTASRKIKTISKFTPTYPLPAAEKTDVRVSFLAPKVQLPTLGRYFFDDPKAKAADVGRAAWDDAFEAARDADA
jgi:hypothetical protein